VTSFDINCMSQNTSWRVEGHLANEAFSRLLLNRMLISFIFCSVAYPGILLWGVQQIQLRTEDGDLGAVAP